MGAAFEIQVYTPIHANSCAEPLPLRSRVVLTLPAILRHCKCTKDCASMQYYGNKQANLQEISENN